MTSSLQTERAFNTLLVYAPEQGLAFEAPVWGGEGVGLKVMLTEDGLYPMG